MFSVDAELAGIKGLDVPLTYRHLLEALRTVRGAQSATASAVRPVSDTYYLVSSVSQIGEFFSSPTFEIRYAGGMQDVLASVREAMSRVDPRLQMFRVRTLDEQTQDSLSREQILIRFPCSSPRGSPICFVSAHRLWITSSATHGTVSEFFDALPCLPPSRSFRLLLASAQTPPSFS